MRETLTRRTGFLINDSSNNGVETAVREAPAPIRSLPHPPLDQPLFCRTKSSTVVGRMSAYRSLSSGSSLPLPVTIDHWNW